MALYGASNQSEIVQSITAAREFLLAHSTGPALEDHLYTITDDWLEEIAEAKTSDALARVISLSNVEATLAWISPLLRFHARNNTGDKGVEIYAGLVMWCDLEKPRVDMLTSVDAEIKKYIAQETARITREQAPVRQAVRPAGPSV